MIRALGWLSVLLLAAPWVASAQYIEDRDGDGSPDLAVVGDWDRDGGLDTRDIQAAVDALTDSGWKDVIVPVGTYAADLATSNTHAFVELDSYTNFACADPTRTVIRGVGAESASLNRSVITNRDHVLGNVSITISDCGIDGAMPTSYDSRTWTAHGRMGIHLNRVRNGVVARNHIWRTHHTCLYAKNTQQTVFQDNVLTDCGGYGDANPYTRKPAIYLFADGSGITRDIVVQRNHAIRSGGPALNTRRETRLASVLDVRFEHNEVDNTPALYAVRPPERCVSIRGVDGLVVSGGSCHATAGVYVSSGEGIYYGDSNAHADANRDVTIENLIVTDTTAERPLMVGSYVDGLRIAGLTIQGSPPGQPCGSWVTPLRGLEIDGIHLLGCGGDGLLQTGPGSGRMPSERVVLRNVVIDGVDAVDRSDAVYHSGLALTGVNDSLTIDTASIAGASLDGIRIGGSTASLTNSTLRGIDIDATEAGYLGRFTASQLPSCNVAREGSWAVVQNARDSSSCVAGGGGAVRNACRCRNGAWVDRTNVPTWRAGIEFSGTASQCNVVESVGVRNLEGGHGIALLGPQQLARVTDVSAVDDGSATGVPQRGAVTIDASAQLVSVTDVSCAGTSGACVQGPTADAAQVAAAFAAQCPLTVDPAWWRTSSCGLGGELPLAFALLRWGRRRLARRSVL